MASSDLVEQIYQQCLARWRGTDLPLEVFRRRVEACGADPGQLALEDLYLATACARGDRVAWEHFADEYLPVLEHLAGQASYRLTDSEELAQGIVFSLMNRPEKMASYDGRATLRGWLRAVAARAAVDRFRSGRREVPLEEITARPTLAEAAEGSDPTDALDARWGGTMIEALREEIAGLPAQDRLVLRLYYLEGVNLQAIGRHFGKHEATASRRLERLRHDLRVRVERTLRRRHGLRSAELARMWELAAAEGTWSLRDTLGDEPQFGAGSTPGEESSQ